MLGLSFDSTIAFSIGISRIASLEAETTGLTYGSLFLSIKGYSVFESMLFMVIDGIFYYLLGRYFDQVIPKEYGLSQPWYFLFTKQYWKGEMIQKKKKVEIHKDEDKWAWREMFTGRHVGDKYIEEVPAELKELGEQHRCVEIQHLVKVFNTPVGPKIAVDDLNVTMYEGQIFCLLGHNGRVRGHRVRDVLIVV